MTERRSRMFLVEAGLWLTALGVGGVGCQIGGTEKASVGADGSRAVAAHESVKIDPSVARDFMRLDRLCWFISLEWNSTVPRDGVTLVVRYDTGTRQGDGQDFVADTAKEAIRLALAEIEEEVEPGAGVVDSEREVLQLSDALGVIKARCWFLRLEKSTGWTVSVKESSEGALTSRTLVASDPSLLGAFDEICAQLDVRMAGESPPSS